MSKLPDRFDTLFPYDEARDSQIDGISRIRDAVDNEGVVTMEGACGTGKTLTALTPYLDAVRDKTVEVDQILAVTSVKQQMEAFQDEIRRINNSLPDNVKPISAVTMVSVSDLHPYVKQGILQDNIYEQIDSLRDGARKLATEDTHDYEFADLYKRALKPNSSVGFPYGGEVPSADGVEYDPYYAKYRAEFDKEEDDIEEQLPFDPDYSGVMTVGDLVEECGGSGYCPHSTMRLAIEHVDVVIGNYMHAFDPKTVKRVSNPILSDDTVAIFDEAHNLVPTVREFLSDETTLTSFSKAREELKELSVLLELGEMSRGERSSVLKASVSDEDMSSFVSGREELVEEVEDILSSGAAVSTGKDSMVDDPVEVYDIVTESGVNKSEVDGLIEFLEDMEDVVSAQVDKNLPIDEGESIRLREPDTPGLDKISDWIRLNRYDGIVKKAEVIGSLCAVIRNEVTETTKTPKTSSNTVGDLVTSWYKRDNTRYYRAIEIERRKQSSTYGRYDWQRDIKANLTIHNCIPRKEISETLDVFHSSVLMSATLEPLDVYHRTTGIRDLKDSGRDIVKCRYGLNFPKENRVTLGIPGDKFKYQNRGPAFNSLGPRTDNDTREQYRDVVFDIVEETNGSVMVVMPSYTEAEWIGTLLEQSFICPSEDVYIDQSSSNKETQEMKEDFFSSEQGVLVTGARGTLIEGVDYIGDRLEATVVCGVPITNTQSDYKVAIQAAYDEIFDDIDGFTLAFTIPAVWKARQAMGRVIRTKQDVGLRILVDERYVDGSEWDSVKQYLSPNEKEEMEYIPPKDLDIRIGSFLDRH